MRLLDFKQFKLYYFLPHQNYWILCTFTQKKKRILFKKVSYRYTYIFHIEFKMLLEYLMDFSKLSTSDLAFFPRLVIKLQNMKQMCKFYNKLNILLRDFLTFLKYFCLLQYLPIPFYPLESQTDPIVSIKDSSLWLTEHSLEIFGELCRWTHHTSINALEQNAENHW